MAAGSPRWQHIEELYHAILECPPAERARLLAQSDPETRREVESLLAQGTGGFSLMDSPWRQPLSPASSEEPLAPGTQVGPYTIGETLGVGGMGRVYRAVDLRLGRTVALKMAHQQFGERFEREARTIAQLNHPHICTLYDVGPTYLVMEHLEGETLEQRLKRGRPPLDLVLRYGAQIADALSAAHARGIVHRDLKPSNIIVTSAGIKVLDFGLAKRQTDQALTQSHLIVGTPAYMAPEQRDGRQADTRSDIYALGLILQEMATGARSTPFAGLPPPFVHIVQRCLETDPGDRWQAASDVKRELEWVGTVLSSHPTGESGASSPASDRRWAWASGLLLALAIAVAAWTILWPRAEALESRLDITTPPTTHPASLALSPDGRTLAFVATSEGKSRLWLRRLNDTTARVLSGTENAVYPFWSPDGRSIGFTVETDLKRIDLESGAVRMVAPSVSLFGGAWLRDNTILVTRNAASPLLRVPAAGGRATSVTATSARSFGHRFPHPLPDGNHFLYFSGGPDTGIHIGALGDKSSRKILDATAAVYAPSGHLLFVREASLYSQPFDIQRLELIGTPTLMAQGVTPATIAGGAALSVAASGTIVYRTGGAGALRHLQWVDRTGKELDTLPEITELGGQDVSLSPDDGSIAWTHNPGDLWLFDVRRRVTTRFTFEPTVELRPVWSPDGQRIVYGANVEGDAFDLFLKSADGSGDVESLLRAPREQVPFDWSPDGKFVLYANNTAGDANESAMEIWAVAVDHTRAPFVVVRTPGISAGGQFSPSGKWIAFQSNESNRFEIYVQPFPQGNKMRISTGGGVQPRWRRDGRELFYLAPDYRLMSVPVDFESATAPKIGTPIPLFTAQWSMIPHHPAIRNFSVSRDGRRFLVDVYGETVSPVTVILNWKPEESM